MTFWFDMDGTIADLYGVDGWLADLVAGDPRPYAEAKPLVRLATLARLLNRLRAEGHKVGVVSWLSKNSTAAYDEAVTAAKKAWLKLHLKSVEFDYIDILPYGTPKQNGRNGILFDDEKPNRDNWNGIAYDVNNIFGVLKAI